MTTKQQSILRYELLALGGDEGHGGGTEASFGLDDELFVVEVTAPPTAFST
jgi:hypothetical protein